MNELTPFQDVENYWVMSHGGRNDVVFHCPSTGSRTPADGVSGEYQDVWGVYNHLHYWANSQESSLVLDIDWDLHGDGWREGVVPKQLLALTRTRLPQPHLTPPTLDPAVLAVRLETDLKYIIEERRKDGRLSTSWCDQLSSLLGQALAGYESSRRGCSAQSQSRDFHCAVNGFTPAGNTFQAFPIKSTSLDVHQLLREGLHSQVSGCQVVLS